MRAALHSFLRSVFRVFPACVTQAQAIAFNMFLAFFPMMLLALGLLTSTAQFRAGEEMVARLRWALPPGSQNAVVDFLRRHGTHPWRWIVLGLGGTLLAGTQAMKLTIDGFQMAYRDSERPGFFSRQFRSLLLLSATFVPWLASVVLTVFGKQLRGWMIRHFGLPALIDRKSTRLNSSHIQKSRMPSSA